GDYANVDNWKFPAKNIALLSSLPKKIFTKAELVSFLNDVYAQLSKKLPGGISSSVQSITAKYNNDGNKMAAAAVTGWYTNYREESLLLIIKAAINNPDDGLLLNNCAAILNMTGIEQKAIPILKYILQSYPDNSMVLNNLGQAYAGLGDTDTAMVYLARSIKIEPENSEANNTAGQIEATKGNKEKAIQYFEKSIKGAYNKPAALKLRKLKKDAKLVPLVRPRVKIPEYFNLFKYQLPEQCTSVENAAVAKAEHAAFYEMIIKQSQMYGGKIAPLVQKKALQSMQPTSRKLQKDEFMAQPFYELCGIMARDIQSDYLKEMSDFNSGGLVFKKYFSDMSSLENEYQSTLKIINDGFRERGERCCGEGKPGGCCPSDEERCIAYNNLANQYLPKFAALTVDWQRKNILVHQKYFDELVYWHYLSLHPGDNDVFLLTYYGFILDYLHTMGGICKTKIIEPCKFTTTSATKESNAIKDYDCPIDISLGFGMGYFKVNCEKLSIRGGEGLLFGYEKNFKTKQSTVSIGAGLRLDLGVKAGPLKTEVGAEVSESFFITFDGYNGMADAGLKNEARLTAQAPKVGLKEVSVGSTLGINSGWNFNEGPFKGMIK
ncbi:MAG: hypothetical protein ABIW34_01860, partial [Ginsengibacter sp.]